MLLYKRMDGVMVSMFASSVVDRGFKIRSGKTNICKITIHSFPPNKAALRSKDCLAQNEDDVSE